MNAFRLDLKNRTVHSNGGVAAPLTSKAFGLLALLTFRRLQEKAGAQSGWVGLDEVALLDTWRGVRTLVSLRRQVRREIEGIEGLGLPVIAYQTKMKGPFRLVPYPAENLPDLAELDRLTRTGGGIRPQTLEEALLLSESAEPLWRGMYFFDRKGTDLDVSLDAFQQASKHTIPLVKALAMVQAGRTLRELARFTEAMAQLKKCAEVADREMPVEIQSFVKASVLLEMAWVQYRRRRFGEAEKLIAEATDYAFHSGQARLLGDILNIRSLLYRRKGQFEDALQTQYTSLEYWLISGHYYGIQSFYHNLACWCADYAKSLPEENVDRRRSLLDSAVTCAKRSVTMCSQYNIGQNTRLSEILLADLYAECGDCDQAIQSALAAWKGATSTGSRYEMAMAAYKILKLRLWGRQFSEAEVFLGEYCKDEGNSAFIPLIKSAFAMMLEQVRSGSRKVPSASGLLKTVR